jgi:CRISPR-associated protein Cas1
MSIEGFHTERYFRQIFQLLPKSIKIQKRRTFKAYDEINNSFNLAYTVLKWKVLRAIIKAKLEPYLGFLHSLQYGKPSLVCDLQELYQHLIDDFLVQYCRRLRKKDFTTKAESMSRKRKGKDDI